MAALAHKTSAWPLAGAYAVLVVYASLYPFSGWRNQEIPPWEFLFAGWPRYWTWFDIAANVVGYVPLGFLLALSFLRRGNVRYLRSHPNLAAIAVAVLAGTLLSFCMEAVQTFLPSRVASNVDFGLNAAGTLLGAGMAAGLELAGVLDHWSRFRERWFIPEARGALVLLALWPFALLFPAAVPLGLGQVLERLESFAADWLQDTPFLVWLPVRDVELQPLCPRRSCCASPGRLRAMPARLHDPAHHRPARRVRLLRDRARNGRDGPVGGPQLGAVARLGLAEPAGAPGAGVRAAAVGADAGRAPARLRGRAAAGAGRAPERAEPGAGQRLFRRHAARLGAGPVHPLPRAGPVARLAVALCGPGVRPAAGFPAGLDSYNGRMTAPYQYYKHHIFFCTNQRDNGEACCANQGAQAAFERCKARVKALGLNGPGAVRVNRAGCMDRCQGGPVAVVYPEGVWYTYVDEQDIDEIVESHLKHGKVVERLITPPHLGR